MVKKQQEFDESVEMYLKTIAELSAATVPVPVTLIASRLGISTVSASEMVHRLEDQHLLEHTPYKGVRMTEEGFRRANAIIRRHQLWEVFLYEKLDLPWAATHNLACKLEHVPSPELEDALDKFLGNPVRCPHGNIIPKAGDSRVPIVGKPLNRYSAGQWVVIERIPIEDDDLLHQLEDAGIAPGTRVEVLDPPGQEGNTSVRWGEKTAVFPPRHAERIYAVADVA